jgi:hypothetical protein
MIFFWIALIALVSFIWALWSLHREKQKIEVEEAKESIKKGRVIYYASESSESSDI